MSAYISNARIVVVSLAIAAVLIGCASPASRSVPAYDQTRYATLGVAIGELYGNKLVRIGTRGFRLKIDGVEVKPQPQWNQSCVKSFGKSPTCDLGSKYIYGTDITKFDIRPGRHLVELCTTLADCGSQEVDFIDEWHTQTIGFVYHLKEYEYRKVAQYQGVSWYGRFEKNKTDAYIEPVTSARGMERLVKAIEELRQPIATPVMKKNQLDGKYDK